MAADGLAGRDAVAAGLAREMCDATEAGRRWIPDYEALVHATGRHRRWCELAVREARVIAQEPGGSR